MEGRQNFASVYGKSLKGIVHDKCSEENNRTPAKVTEKKGEGPRKEINREILFKATE